MIQAVPELARHLPDPLDFNEAAADYFHLFGFNVFAYESIFLDDSGLLGGQTSEGVARSYSLFGFKATGSGESADHIGQELAALAYLCAAEMDALENGTKETAVAVQAHQIQFLQDHLLRWISPLLLAVKAQNDPFFVAVAELTLALIYDHYLNLLSNIRPLVVDWKLAKAPNLLNDDKTGLKEIASLLTLPVLSGVYFSRHDIGRLAHRLDLPRGFGDRQQLLTNLMRTAVQYDKFANLLEVLKSVLTEWQLAFRQQANEMPSLAGFIQPWQEQAEQTSLLISQMRDQLAT